MYARVNRQPKAPKPRKSESKKWVAPVAGWVANRALSDPSSIEGQGAAILDNFYPRATSVALRRGKRRYCMLGDGSLPARSVFTYKNGINKKLFAANDTTIYDITDVEFAEDAVIVDGNGDLIGDGNGNWFGWSSTQFLASVSNFTNGEWSVVQFATTGGVYLVGVNGADTGFVYDGELFYPYVEGGVWKLSYDNETDPFTVGDVVTGGTSGATGTIWQIVGTGTNEGTLILTDVTGDFEDNEALTDTDGGAADAVGTQENAVPGIEFPNGLTSADMIFVWVYRSRLFFVERDSMNAHYLPTDNIGGTATAYPFAGIFGLGGSLLFGAAWSLDQAGVSGLSEQCVFVSDQGEVAVFQGTNPSEAGTWNKVGIYRIGTPFGRRAFTRGGGDLAIATTVGLVPLSKAISLDVTALNVATVSYKIADAWEQAKQQRGATNWVCHIWAEGKMALIAPPSSVGAGEPEVFVSNTETGAWGRFTGWNALCMETFEGRLYIGSPDGKVFIANEGGLDDGAPYSGAAMPLFEDFGNPGALKIPTLVRARVRSNVAIGDQVDAKGDFDMDLPPPPDATAPGESSTWGAGIWGKSQWGGTRPNVISEEWRSAGGDGYSISALYQVTSGALAPLDAELIDIQLLYQTAEVLT